MIIKHLKGDPRIADDHRLHRGKVITCGITWKKWTEIRGFLVY